MKEEEEEDGGGRREGETVLNNNHKPRPHEWTIGEKTCSIIIMYEPSAKMSRKSRPLRLQSLK